MRNKVAAFLVVALAVLVGLSSCTTGAASTLNEWSLVELRLDVTALQNRGVLPVWRAADVSEFGQVPRAQGRMSMTAAGRVLVDVGVDEPVLTLGGHKTVQSYRLVGFAGMMDASRNNAVQQDADAMRVPLGVATRLTLTHQGNDRITVQAFTADKPLPYIYVFEAGPPRQSAVFMPTTK